jgi:U3 small nucleolar RNA-associated protein 10
VYHALFVLHFCSNKTGLEELIAENSHFAPFKKSLLNAQSIQTEREQLGKDFNERLDASIHNFLSLVSDYLLLTPAHHVLEYLIRRYR